MPTLPPLACPLPHVHRACMPNLPHACMHPPPHACLSACLPTPTHGCMHACMPAHSPTCMHAPTPACPPLVQKKGHVIDEILLSVPTVSHRPRVPYVIGAQAVFQLGTCNRETGVNIDATEPSQVCQGQPARA